MNTAAALETLLDQISACRVCAAHLPLGPRPVVRADPRARLLIIGQAPGTRVHASGIPWNDPSGNRLRDWLQMDRDSFYDTSRIAIMPMGFCYPGRLERGGDAPPRPECAPLWHAALRARLPNIRLTLLVGSYAQRHYLNLGRKITLTETVRKAEQYAEHGYFPTPHPSWRSQNWLKKNPWYEAETLQNLRAKLRDIF